MSYLLVTSVSRCLHSTFQIAVAKELIGSNIREGRFIPTESGREYLLSNGARKSWKLVTLHAQSEIREIMLAFSSPSAMEWC